jgi:CubicO group peptidase (beta-lactamase class C family)
MLETVSGDSYESLVRKRLWAPLGMHSGGFNTPGTPGKIDQPWGHFSWGASIDPGSPAAGDPAFIAPAGLAVMTIADWAKFIALHLRGDPSDPNRQVSLITPESFVRLHVPAAGEDYAGGWGVSTRSWAKGPRPGDVGRVLLHAGSNGRSYCVAFLAPEIDFAVIVACNQGGDEAAKACDDAAGALIRSFGKKAYFLNRH